MSESTPPPQAGQETSPNPIELFWEKNRRGILLVIAAVVVGLGIHYALKYTKEAEADRTNSLVLNGPNLDNAYADAESSGGLVAGLAKDLANADEAELAKALTDLKGTDKEHLVLWLAAQVYHEKAIAADDPEEREAHWGEAIKHIEALKSGYPKSQFVLPSELPPQWRKQVEPAEDATEAERAKLEFEDGVAGSPADRLLAQITSQKQFFKDHDEFYTPVRPDEGSPVVEFEFEGFGTVKFELYERQSTELVHKFLDLVDSGHFNGLRIHSIVRQRSFFPGQLDFGLPSTRDDDRTAWQVGEASDEANHVEKKWTEDRSAISHFPGVLSAQTAPETKSDASRVSMFATDAADMHDGSLMPLGIVATDDDLATLEDIVASPLSTEQESQMGRGRPQQNITITAKIIQPGTWKKKDE